MSEPQDAGVLFLGLVLLSAIFAATEAALAFLGKPGLQRLSERNLKVARMAAVWEEHPDRIVLALVVAREAMAVGAAIVAAQAALSLAAGPDRRWVLAATWALVTGVLLVVGRMAPGYVARGRAEAIVARMSRTVRLLMAVTAPFAWVLSRVSFGLAYAVGGRPAPAPSAVTEEEMMALVEAGVVDGAIEQEERELIHSIFEFADTTVREVMVPRVDMVCVDALMPMDDILEVFADRKFSRLPVFDETVDNIVGIIHVKNILNFWRRRIADMKAMEFVAMPHFVPEAKKVIELLEEFREKQIHMAIVVDEYGGTAGLVTMEDLIEEIVGEIEDEHNRATHPVRKAEDGSFVVDARVEIDRLNDTLSISLPKGEFETVGGLLYHHLGKIPSKGEHVEFGGVRITVLDGDARRIRRVRLEVLRGDEGESLGGG